MPLFDALFGSKKDASPPNADVAFTTIPNSEGTVTKQADAPGTTIRHDPRLLEALREDHRLLLDIYKAIDKARRDGELLTVQTRLDQFRMALQDHLLKENVRLYVYIERRLQGDPDSRKLIREFRQEMEQIGRALMEFLGKYRQIGIHPELASEFDVDYLAIGKALTTRIRREEDLLYPMYDSAA